MKKGIAFAMAAVLTFASLPAGTVLAMENGLDSMMPGEGNNAGMGNGNDQMGGGSSDSSNIAYSAVLQVTDTQVLSGVSYTSSSADESVVLVSDGGVLTLSDSTLTKSSGASSNTENSEFYGVNAGFLVLEGSTATITGTTISTSATGSNAVFATGTDAKIYISDSTITTTGSSSARGLDATYGGYINASNVTIVTQGGSCAAVATDRGGGTVIVTGSDLQTNGSGSPVIYTTGDISVSDSTGSATAAQLVVVEGKNSATVSGSTITATGSGNRGTTDVCGIMIYQSQSGDAEEGTGTFTATGSTLSIVSSSSYYATAPMFFITNTDAVINLSNTTLSFGSGILLDAEGTSEWGSSGSNGGNVTLNAANQTLEGNIVLDSLSSLALNLTGSSSYTGTINGANTASGVTLALESSSSIQLTGDSYVTSLSDADSSYSNIDLNGYTLYVNGVALEGNSTEQTESETETETETAVETETETETAVETETETETTVETETETEKAVETETEASTEKTAETEGSSSGDTAQTDSSASGTSSAGTSLAAGTQITKGKFVYTVTAANQVQVTSLTDTGKQKTKLTVPATITYRGVVYSVTAIGNRACYGNSVLTRIIIGENVKTIGTAAFANCAKLASVEGMAAVTSIGNKAFYGCTSLARVGSVKHTVTLTKVKTIGASAFYGCSALSAVNLSSKKLVSIGAKAFYNCTSMTSFVSKSAKLASIGTKAFYNTTKLSSFKIYTTLLTSENVGAKAFTKIYSSCTFRVPSSVATAYKTLFRAKGAGKSFVVKKISA